MKSDAFANAVQLLSRREHGAYELSHKLLQKGYSEPAVQEALIECQRLGLQSDVRFVESRCRVRIRQGYGPLRIRRELQHLEIEALLIEDVLQQERDNWLHYAKGVWEKKYKKQGVASFTDVQKQKQFLLYRGFSTDTIMMMFKDYENFRDTTGIF